VDIHSGEKIVTNTFHYTFTSKTYLQRFILPETYRRLTGHPYDRTVFNWLMLVSVPRS
jgi:hypothetical protein